MREFTCPHIFSPLLVLGNEWRDSRTDRAAGSWTVGISCALTLSRGGCTHSPHKLQRGARKDEASRYVRWCTHALLVRVLNPLFQNP